MDDARALIDALSAARETSLALDRRPLDREGRPGGLVELPPEEAVYVIGDLHGSFESLEAILGSSRLEARLDRGEARLVLLGDLLHDDRPGRLADMGGSVLLLRRVCELLAAHPGRLIWLRGNHDSFDPQLTKGWVFQGRAFLHEMEGRGGAGLVRATQELFDALPLAALGPSLLLLHAGPPRGGIGREELIGALPGSELARELVWNRIEAGCPGPGGYGLEDLLETLRRCGLGEGSALVVGHNPLWSRENSSGLWTDVGLAGHHILYSGALGRAPWLLHEGGRLQARFARRGPLL